VKRTTSDVLALAGMGLLIRLGQMRSGVWSSGDSPEYLTLAKNIVLHHSFSLGTEAGALLPTARRPPLYPALIAAFWWGESPPIAAIILLQILLGAATVGLVYLMAHDKFNRPVALIAGAIMALAPLSSHYTAAIMTETLFTFLITCGFFLWGREKPTWAGIFFGLGALTRPTMLPFLVVLPLLSLLPAWRARWRVHLLILCAALAVSSIWIVRNAIVFGEPIPIAASGWGTNLLVGTIETKVVGDDVWTAVINDPVLRVDVSGVSETEADRILLRMALRRIADDPLHWLSVRARQYPRLFIDSGDYWLHPSTLTFQEALRESRFIMVFRKIVFVFGHMLFWSVAFYGVYTQRKRFVELSHLTLFPIFLLLAQLPMWVETRYSLPIIPLVTIMASAGVVHLIENVRVIERTRAGSAKVSSPSAF
jgi:4-amino-4-deoxy-L-arabinose transferase-like glycosyltransferase